MSDATELTARGQGYYVVFVNDVQTSQHLQEREAAEQASIKKLEDPSADVHYTHEYIVDVRIVSIITADATPPAVPSGLTVGTVTDTQVPLSWDANDELDFFYYSLYRSLTTDTPDQYTKITGNGNVTGTSYTDTGRPPGQTAYYRITATDRSSNESARSNSVNTQTLAASYYVAPTSQGTDSGLSEINATTLDNLPQLIPGDIVYMAEGSYETAVSASVDSTYSHDGTYGVRPVGLPVRDTNGTEADPIRFVGAGTGAILKGPDAQNSLEFGLYVDNCSWIEFENVHADGSRSSGLNWNPRLRLEKLGVLLDSTNITMNNCTFVRCNASRGFLLMRSDLCHIHDSTFQYCGHPDKFQDADPYSADDFNIQPNNPDVGDLFTTDETSKYNLIEDCNISFGGHIPVAAHGEYNIFRRITTDNSWPTAEFGTMNVQSPHPFLSRAFLNGRPFGNRHASTRGGASNGGFSGRNVLEHFTVLNAEEAVDAGQLVRIAGSNTIYRFNAVQIASSTNDGMGNTATTTNPERHAYSCEIYNNEYIDIDDFRGYGDRGFNRTVGSTDAGAAWNRNYNNAHGAFNAGAYQFIAEIQNSDWAWVNANHPNIGDNSHPTLTNSWSHNVFAHNTFADADTALSIEVPTGGFGTVAAVQDRSDGVTENHVFGNVGGAFKSATAGMAHAQTTNASAVASTGPIALDTTNPFVAPNLYLQMAGGTGDQVVINGQTTRITEINEATKEITVDTAVTWTSGIDVAIASTVIGSGVSTGAPAYELVTNLIELTAAIGRANASTGGYTIEMAAGNYTIGVGGGFGINADDITIYGQSTTLTDLRSAAMADTGGTTDNIFWVNASNFTLRDLSVGRCGNHGVQVNEGNNGHTFDGVRFYDCYEQMLKGTTSAGTGVANVTVTGCTFEYTTPPLNYYMGGIDCHRADNWTVTGNTFKEIEAPSGQQVSEHAIHLWNGSTNSTIEKNTIINCDRGIGVGLGTPNGDTGHTIKNNYIYHANNGAAFGDVGIDIAATDTKCYNNTVIQEHSYLRAIEYRTTGADIQNNLTNKAIDNLGTGSSVAFNNNITNAQVSWFVDPANGDLSLSATQASVVNAGATIVSVTEDHGGTTRPQGNEYDIGGDEYTSPPLLQSSDITYIGSMSLPLDLGYGASLYAPGDGTFWAGTDAPTKGVGQCTIPALGGTGVMLTGPVAMQGQLADSVHGGSLLYNNKLIHQLGVGYDGDRIQTQWLRVSDTDLTNIGGLRTATGWDDPDIYIRYLMGGGFGIIPSFHRTKLGGNIAYTANSRKSIITNESIGPGFATFDPDAVLAGQDPVQLTDLIWYDLDSGKTLPAQPNAQGGDDWVSQDDKGERGCLISADYNTILFLGFHGYGPTPQGGADYCDPGGQSSTHSGPYRQQAWAYDIDHVAEVVQGTREPYECVPYAVWDFSAIGGHPDAPNNDTICMNFGSVAFDPSTKRIYIRGPAQALDIDVYQLA